MSSLKDNGRAAGVDGQEVEADGWEASAGDERFHQVGEKLGKDRERERERERKVCVRERSGWEIPLVGSFLVFFRLPFH